MRSGPVYHPRVMEAGDYVRTIGGVDVFQWNPARRADGTSLGLLGNAGDLLGPIVVERMLWRKSLSQRVPRTDGLRLFSVGSVLHFANDGDVVWGAGVNGKAFPTPLSRWPQLDVRAVRGPWTARLLSSAGLRVPAVFGDPALLVGRLVPELSGWARATAHDTLIVPNFNDMTSFRDAAHEVLSPMEPLWTVLRAIAKSRFVVGSSLHAVAVADALGVPARFVVSEHENPFKYRDYLAGTGRPTTRIAQSVEHALDLGPHRPAEVDTDALERAFPWDLWGFDADEHREVSKEFEPDALQSAWLDRIARDSGSQHEVRHFLDHLVPQVRQAALDDNPDLESLVSQAVDYLTEVAPEALTEQMNADTQRLVQAIMGRDASRVRLAALLDGSPAKAMLRSAHIAGDHLIVELVLHNVPNLATATSVELVLTERSTGRVARQPMTLFDVQRVQWHVDIEALVDRALLGEGTWAPAVEVAGPNQISIDVVAPGPEALGLLALERGNLHASAPLAIITKYGADVLPEPKAIAIV